MVARHYKLSVAEFRHHTKCLNIQKFGTFYVFIHIIHIGLHLLGLGKLYFGLLRYVICTLFTYLFIFLYIIYKFLHIFAKFAVLITRCYHILKLHLYELLIRM